MFKKEIPALSARDMYEEFRMARSVRDAKIEKFFGADGFDVYNPSVPFEWDGKEYIAGRVERRDSENSEVRFFERREDGWYSAEGTVKLPLQDPFVTKIDGKIVLGGVSVTFPEVKGGDVYWQTDFYIGTPFGLEKFLSGPKQMKDVRLTQLRDGRIAVMSRPQGASMEKYGCISKIGFTIVDSLQDLTAEIIENAPFIEKIFCDDEWGGANQIVELANGKLGVVGHKSYRSYEADGQRLHYYGMAFAIDPETRELTQNKLIVSRDCFPDAEAKRFDLGDVTFTSGLVRLGDGTVRIYTGLSDAHVGSAILPDPFAEYEG